MLYVETGSTSPYFNLAAEEYLTTQFKEEICMLWRNSSSIIVGRNQNTMAEIDYDFVTANDIPVVRRMSGGGAVFHDLNNLNFTYIVNGGEFGDYVGFTSELREYIKTLGIETTLSGRNDILAGGRKFSGNAQYKYHDRLMHHGTIMINADISHLVAALKPDETKIASKGIKSVKSRVANLAEFADTDVLTFMNGFEEYIKRNPDVKDYKLTDTDIAEIEKSVKEKYSTFEWNFGYSPKYTFRKKARFEKGGLEVFLEISDGKIKGCELYGDFFSSHGTEELLKSLINTNHEKSAAEKAIGAVWYENILGGISLDQFLSCLF
ncbi:MAG: lipoate--protein ligase [Clostridia bacterium]|nr:lipoate--protein ligase [Clostridia bacterium]